MDDGGVRQRFTVELRPEETTIVSWKKLVKDTTAKASTSSPPVVAPMPKANAVLDSPLAQGQPAENELKDGHPSRFTDVIEKIERLYMGKHSSDEEDLNDVPDDDEYDTEDSFIDDTELDDYFQVDKSAIKHDGFFVNRGKLERINEPTSLPNQQPKKRRRKDLANDHSDGDKRVKVRNKAAGKSKKLVGIDIGLPHVVALPSVRSEEIKFPNQMKTPVISAKKKSTEIKTPMDPSIFSSVSNRDAALSVMGKVNIQVPEMLSSKNVVEAANGSVLKSEEKSASTQSMSYGNGDLVQSVQERERGGNPERLALNVSAGKVPMQNAKTLIGQRKESSIIKPKSTNLEKTIGELEKMVAESRPQSMNVLDADTTSQTVKKRLPREVKQKLAKVARQAQAIHGSIPEELVNRLMSILGHLVQVRTLKRNLKDMVSMGLTLKKEKDNRLQQMKKDIAELVRMRVPYINSKVLEQQASGSDDFQEMDNEEKEFIRKKHGMDNVIEDKICDLYDLYVDGLDEDAGPQARKLYYELAHLWPEGFMDNHEIKRAICRAKNRKRALYGRSKDQEKVKRKKMVSKSEGTVRVDASLVAQPYHTQNRSVSDLDNHGVSSSNRSVPSTTSTNPSVGVASSTPSEPSLDHPKGSNIDLNEKDPMDVLA